MKQKSLDNRIIEKLVESRPSTRDPRLEIEYRISNEEVNRARKIATRTLPTIVFRAQVVPEIPRFLSDYPLFSRGTRTSRPEPLQPPASQFNRHNLPRAHLRASIQRKMNLPRRAAVVDRRRRRRRLWRKLVPGAKVDAAWRGLSYDIAEATGTRRRTFYGALNDARTLLAASLWPVSCAPRPGESRGPERFPHPRLSRLIVVI